MKWPVPLVVAVLAACGSPSDPVRPDPEPPPPDTVTVRPVPCLTATKECAERIEISSGLYLPVFSTHALSEGHAEVNRAVVVVHGMNRNSDDYFTSGTLAAVRARESERAVVISPRFQTNEDGPANDEPYWSSAGWRRGNLSRPEGPSPRVSSFLAMDRIVEALANRARFPQISQIVITGHSAGGQFVHRYAATSPVEDVSVATAGVRYVVANPSSYLYVRPERWLTDDFGLPDSRACPEYDDWHYGLRDRNNRTEDLATDTVWARITRRDIRILIGSADTTATNLDTSCEGYLQGLHRYDRGQTLVRFMDKFFEGHGHREMVVPGIGHSSRDMWTSEVGLTSLFGG